MRVLILSTDDLPSALVLVVSLVLFACLSLAHYSLHSNSLRSENSFTGSSQVSTQLESLIPWFKYACVIAVAVSGLVLLQSSWTESWWPVSLLAFGVLIFLATLDRAAGWTTGRRSSRSNFLQRPVDGNSQVNGSEGKNGFNGNWNGLEGALSVDGASNRPQPEITEAELSSLDHRDREMLRSILRLDVTTAREIMTPRLDMVAVEGDSTLAQVSDVLVSSGHSRLPVYEETIDRILGVLYSRDVLDALATKNRDENIRDLIRPAFIIPESKRLDNLLEELQERGVQLAVVVDEYGGTEGLITMEDVLEEIVGEIEDEFSQTRESLIDRLPDGAVLVDAGITTEDVEEIFGTRIETTDVDTAGGLVYHNLGKIPQTGDVVITDNLRIEVISILGRRLRKLRINQVELNGTEVQE